jgi:hypothetical protein
VSIADALAHTISDLVGAQREDKMITPRAINPRLSRARPSSRNPMRASSPRLTSLVGRTHASSRCSPAGPKL